SIWPRVSRLGSSSKGKENEEFLRVAPAEEESGRSQRDRADRENDGRGRAAGPLIPRPGKAEEHEIHAEKEPRGQQQSLPGERPTFLALPASGGERQCSPEKQSQRNDHEDEPADRTGKLFVSVAHLPQCFP